MPQPPRLTDPAYQKFLDEVPVKPPPLPPPANLFRFEIVNEPREARPEISDAWAEILAVGYRRLMELPPIFPPADDDIYCPPCRRDRVECPSCGALACVLGQLGPDEYLMMPCGHLAVLDDDTAACLGLGA